MKFRVYFVCYYVGRSLAKHQPSLTFLSSNTRPDLFYRPSYYDFLLLSLDGLCTQFSIISITNSTVTSIFVKIKASSRALSTSLDNRADKNINWRNVWPGDFSTLATGFENDVSWKVKQRVLKTACYLKSWDLNINPNCEVCDEIEDINNIFLKCKIARQV